MYLYCIHTNYTHRLHGRVTEDAPIHHGADVCLWWGWVRWGEYTIHGVRRTTRASTWGCANSKQKHTHKLHHGACVYVCVCARACVRVVCVRVCVRVRLRVSVCVCVCDIHNIYVYIKCITHTPHPPTYTGSAGLLERVSEDAPIHNGNTWLEAEL